MAISPNSITTTCHTYLSPTPWIEELWNHLDIYNLMKGMIILRIFLFHHGILEPPMKTNLCHSQFVLMLWNIHFFFLGPLPIGIPSHWLFVSRSRFSPSMGVCWARHPPTVDDHDTPAVTGGLHPLLDISPKNRRTWPQKPDEARRWRAKHGN